MKRRGRWWARLGLVVLVAVGGSWYVARAQNFLGQVPTPPLPDIPPQGAWGEVIMANSKWLVVQNHVGQQFPVLIDANHIHQFLVRWPTDISNLTPASLIEALGADLGSNTLQTDHVDVFEGSDQLLVAPTYRSILPNNRPITTIDPSFNRMMNAWDISAQSMLYGWTFPVSADASAPVRLHIVGNVLLTDPVLRLGIQGNNFANIVPGATGSIQMTQVTLGTWSFLEKGDLVFLNPINLDQKSLYLQQLILYKRIPRNRYAP